MTDTVFYLVRPSVYFDRIEPAAQRFSETQDIGPLIALLREGEQRLANLPIEKNPHATSGQRDNRIQLTLNVLEGREFYRPSTNHIPASPDDRTTDKDLDFFVQANVWSDLFTSLCLSLESDVPASLTLTRGRLLPYLYEHSLDLEYAFTVNLMGEALTLFPDMELLSRDSVQNLIRLLEQVPEPDDAEEDRRARSNRQSFQTSGSVFVSSQFADLLGPAPGKALRHLKQLLRTSLAEPDLGVMQSFG